MTERALILLPLLAWLLLTVGAAWALGAWVWWVSAGLAVCAATTGLRRVILLLWYGALELVRSEEE